MKSVIAAAALVVPSLVSAISFTDPAANATVTKGSYFDLTWSTVDTDPETFSVYLVNFVNWPPSYEPLALDVETASGEASVYVPCDADSSYGFQFNAINGTNTYVIYAQTPKFFIGGSSCSDPVSTTTATCAAATVTVTVSANATAAGLGNSSSIATTTPRVTIGGECPTTIGWGPSGIQPVTLTSVPTAPGSKKTAPAVINNAATTTAPYGFVSTVYQTTYIDMAEATGACAC